MAIASNFPAIRPSLNLDFANARTLDPRITFSRASAATYYDGKTVAKAEENLLLRSQEFDQAPWEKLLTGAALAPVVTANAGTAPDGTVTADRVVFSLNGGVSSGDISQLVQTLTLSGQYVFSVWLRSTDGSSTYNMQLAGAGAVADVTVTGTWQRFMVTGTYAGAYSNQLRLRGAQGVVNSNTADVLVWGAQLEQRSQVTAYTPTTTQPITNYVPVLQTAPAGVPRFDHNPVTGESLGLLVEEQRTNLLTYSYGQWANQAMVISDNVAIAPDGSLSAAKAARNTSSTIHGAYKPFSTVVGTVYTYSAYARAAENSRVRISDNAFSTFGATFDLSTGAIVGSGGSALLAAHAPVNVGNGWWRVAVSFTAANALTYPALCNLTSSETGTSNGSPYSAAGDGYSGIYIWGAQLEAGSFPTSYIKTEASQVTRAADSASMTGANFSSWFSQGEGTVFSEYAVQRLGIYTPWYISIASGAATERIQHVAQLAAAGYGILVQIGGVSQCSISAGTPSIIGVTKQASAFQANNFAAAIHGLPSITDTAGAIPQNLALLTIGSRTTSEQLNGHIRRITYYPKRLTDAQLQALTA